MTPTFVVVLELYRRVSHFRVIRHDAWIREWIIPRIDDQGGHSDILQSGDCTDPLVLYKTEMQKNTTYSQSHSEQ